MTTPASFAECIPLVAGNFAAGHLASPQQIPAIAICSSPCWNGFEFDPGKDVHKMAVEDMSGVESTE
jgi:hypothetical protein